ncbi:hypothetical protein COCCADRAFT_39667 [Bipolaris zeicola 26-R-13]|uniref:Zn(2)-C6 fungal-type domain-containing protein n=1 Tax=Cochliobolus carbonum (strain 26-R-13) TaxID=930089 RepID=W6XW73_COCC2|nr:uncharacterized protein COCCADRAFT_39667 [Bipolaris zeicola 26-R-13]EUC30023.1 hypothetical protein COCCADRAFT_39667 [Bipolaris zeicola 26-R-13]
MAEGASSSPGRSTRMSRNAACTHCRTSKVRCNPSSIAGRPCQRCTKLNLSCVVNPTCRRTTRKSQLDQLAREVQAIRETVVVDSINIARQPALQTPSSPSTWSPRVQGANEASSSSVTPAFSAAASEHNSRHGDNAVVVDDTPVDSTAVPSVHRALDSQPFTGPDIDEHFNIYFRYFHPHFPILSQRDPNKCYDTSPFLFWVIVLISCRRRPTNTNPATIRLLAEHVKHETDAAVPKVPQPLAQLHAILLVAAWGLYPGVRFINDPAYWLSGIAINSCLLLGFHTASGRHPEYNHVTLGTISSDIEAAVTWVASAIVNRRLSTNLGLPCTAPMNKATLNVIHDEASLLPISFRVQLECQVFMDRVNKTLGSSLEESNGVPYELVRMFEDEWVAARARIISKHTDPVLSLHTLFVLLEVQMYYFLPIPTQNSQSSPAVSSLSGRDNLPPSIEADILRCYTTASTVITRVMDLDKTTDLLHYLPHYTIRPIAHAVTVIFRVIRSDLPLRHLQIVVPEEASKLSAHTITISRRISAVEGDLAWRLARCVELWDTTSAPYIAAAAASRFNAPIGNENENNNNSDQAGSAGASPDYEPVLVEMFRQRMVAALGWDFMIRWKSKHGPVHMGPYKPHPQTQTMGMHVSVGEASSHMQHQQQTPSTSSTGTSGPDGGPARFQVVQQDQQLFQSQQQQQTGMPGNVSSATVPPGETEPSLSSTGTTGTDSLLGTDWGFLDDFIWGFDSQDP